MRKLKISLLTIVLLFIVACDPQDPPDDTPTPPLTMEPTETPEPYIFPSVVPSPTPQDYGAAPEGAAYTYSFPGRPS